ncbi:MAG: NAD-dependent epimerase/dehydratase family protein [Euryarchaeota archaeon]|nr:NAD-dependent epimerase/dehydratase family protein [Euryarchaeota archaeon]
MPDMDPPVDLDPWTELLSGRRILVTGSTGYIASRLVPAFQTAGADIVRLLRPESTEPDEDGTGGIRGDCHDPATWRGALDQGVDTVIHLAAQTSVKTAAADPVRDWHNSVAPFLTLLATCAEHETSPTILLAGTATEVGMTPPTAVDETVREDPVTIYDLHKLTNERYLRHYTRQGTVRGATLRLANVYGPGPTSSTADRGILGMMVRRALAGEDLTVYGDGAFLRDYVYIDDVVRAFAALAATPDAVQGGDPYLVATGTGTSLKDAFGMVVAAVEAETGRRAVVSHVEPPAALDAIDTRDFVADPGRLIARTKWEPKVTLGEGIARTVRAIRSMADTEVTI